MLRGIFEFEIVTKSSCLHCGVPNDFYDSNQYSLCLALPQQVVPNPTTLDHLLQNRANGYFDHINSARRCPDCHQTAGNIQFARFATAPEVLVLELKRFTRVNGAWHKNTSPVSFTQDLDLSPVINHTAVLKYRLIAVIHQQGSLNSGQYKAVTKTPGGKWEEIHDMAVSKVRVGAALKPAAPWLPFMLVYTRVDGQVSVMG
ncbi:MAG: hypothetical protein Q9175_005614 [Cornicularia normoerica]